MTEGKGKPMAQVEDLHGDEETQVFHIPLEERIGRTVLVAGTFDTKSRELNYMADALREKGIPVRTVDLSTSGKASASDVPALEVASMAPGGASSVMTGDRGASVSGMAASFAKWIAQERGIGGILSAGGSGGTSLATAGMRALPFGIPKLMVSTVASSDVSQYVGASDILMMHSVADVQGINRITEVVLSNAAHAIGGMVAGLPSAEARKAKAKEMRPAIGLTMFGVTTTLVQAVIKELEADYDCLTFHATGIGGRSMETLVDSGDIAAVLDLTTTEVADMLGGGVFPATEDRFGSIIRSRVPYVGSVGALDMINFGARNTVPEKFNSRKFVVHNAAVTLMRTTVEENRRFGSWIAERLNKMTGPVRFLLPEGGVSALDKTGQPFDDPAARAALFETIEREVTQTQTRRVIRVPAHINDPAFVDAALKAFRAIAPTSPRRA